jgi:hypothetical protein
MEIPIQTKLEERVYRAAEVALVRQHYVSAIDLLCGMGLLASSAVDSWRKGRIDFLESEIQGNPNKISSSIAIFLRWAHEKGLKPSETDYVRPARSGTVPLQFFSSGAPRIEKIFRTHYVSPALSERKQKKLQEKLEKAPQPVVFLNLRDAQCSECGAEIAQEECVQDADERAAARARAAALRGQLDRKLVAQMIKLMAELFPGCSLTEIAAIAAHTAVRGSGRVGRSEAGRNLDEKALTLAVCAAVRHNHTPYDELLASGVDRVDARQQIAG